MATNRRSKKTPKTRPVAKNRPGAKRKFVAQKDSKIVTKKGVKKVSPVPAGYHSVTPYLSIRGASAALAFYKKAFGAKELFRMDMPGGMVGHAEIQIEGSRIMLADEFPDMPDIVVKSPQTLGGTTSGLCIYLRDVDARFAQAVAAGAVVKRPVTNQFYGDRAGTVLDPFGHLWTLSTHVEDLSTDQIMKRAAAMDTTGGAK